MKRFKDGIGAQNGASNLAGLARSLKANIEEALAELASPSVCPGIQLMIHQMSHVTISGEHPSKVTLGERTDTLTQQIAHQYRTTAPDDFLSWAAARLIEATDAARAKSVMYEDDGDCRHLVSMLHLVALGDCSCVGWGDWESAMDACRAKAQAESPIGVLLTD